MEKKIKVLFLTSLFGKMGGAEKNIYDIVLNIDKTRFTPYVFCLKGGELVDDIRRRGIESRIIGLDKIISIEGIRKGAGLYRFLKSEKIDVVVTYHHDADIWGGAIAMLARVSAVVSSRRDLGYQLEKKHVWAYRALNRFYTRIISVSDAVKREIMRREWTPGGKIITVYNGVEIERYRQGTDEDKDGVRDELGIGPGKKIIGVLGSLRPVKGHIYLVRAAAEVINRNRGFKVVVVGYKDTEYYKEVKGEIDRLGLEGYFVFLGDRRDVPRLLSAFDIMVLPSLSEGFSNAALEGMASGKPVIATDCGGNPEAVVRDLTGLLVRSGDVHSLAEAVLKLLEDGPLCERMGEAALKRVTSQFSLKKMIDANEDIFSCLAGEDHLRAEPARVIKKSLKKSCKMALSYGLYYSGMAKAVKRLYKRPRVLAYHSINRISLRPLEIEQEPDNFERQIDFLKSNFKIIRLSEYLDCVRNGRNDEDSILITFDDGYRDNYENAFPILKKYGAPAVIFLTTDPMEKKGPLFFDALRHGVMRTSRLTLDLRNKGLKRYVLDRGNEMQMSCVIREITAQSKLFDNDSKAALLLSIYERLGLDYEEVGNSRLYLSWEEVSEMAECGIEFGSHTKTHPQLSNLTAEECDEELRGSKRIIEKRTGRAVRALAYPFGGALEYNKMVEDVALKAGYECAFSLTQKSKSDLFTFGRKMVDSHMSSKLSGRFCKPLFLADLLRA